MRSRNIKPGFFENEALGMLKPLARLLFAGLWCVADRQGRLEDRPERIRAMLLPYDRCDVNKLLDDLDGAGFIRRYEVDGNKYIWVVKFLKHQNPHRNEKGAGIPPPDEVGPCRVQEQEKHTTTRVKVSSAPADSLISDSLISDSLISDSLISDSLIPDTLTPHHGGAAPVEHLNGQANSCVCVDRTKNHDDGFEHFISDWPHQVNVSHAHRVWVELFRATPDAAALEREIVAGKARYQASDQWSRGVYDAPDRWLLNEKWKDHPAAKKTTDTVWTKVAQEEE